jgi:type I restriction enzyme R subunit
MATAEERAREGIERPLTTSGWSLQDFKVADIQAARGLAIREFVLDAGQAFKFADEYICA